MPPGTELGHDKALVRQQQVGPEHRREGTPILRIASMAEQQGRLSPVEVIGHPRRGQRLVAKEILSGGGPQVKGLDGGMKFQAGTPDRLQLGQLLARYGPGLRRELPGLRLKQRLRRERGLEVSVGEIGRHGAIFNDQ
jgi:hypothetical protein